MPCDGLKGLPMLILTDVRPKPKINLSSVFLESLCRLHNYFLQPISYQMSSYLALCSITIRLFQMNSTGLYQSNSWYKPKSQFGRVLFEWLWNVFDYVLFIPKWSLRLSIYLQLEWHMMLGGLANLGMFVTIAQHSFVVKLWDQYCNIHQCTTKLLWTSSRTILLGILW